MTLQNYVLDSAAEARPFSHSQDGPIPEVLHRLLQEVRSSWQPEYPRAEVCAYLPLLLGAVTKL